MTLGFAHVLKKQAEGRGERKGAELAGLISQSGEHLLNIVQDVLFMAGDQSEQKVEISSDPVDLCEVIDFSMQTMAGEYEKQTLTALWGAPQDPAFVHGDVLRLQQAMLNLLTNAVNFNRPDGGVKIQLSDAGTYWRIDVIDTGMGMSRDQLKKVSQMFSQADDGHSRKQDGLGIGINLVDRIVSRRRGHMQTKSQPDYGTAVSVFLPKLIVEDEKLNPDSAYLAA